MKPIAEVLKCLQGLISIQACPVEAPTFTVDKVIVVLHEGDVVQTAKIFASGANQSKM